MAPDKQITFEIEGKKLAAQQLGYFSFRWSAQMGQELLQDFHPNKVGASFPVASAIVQNPFVAHLYLTGLHVATYLAFITSILRVPPQGVSQFLAGLKESIADLRTSNGMALDSKEQQNLLHVISALARSIDEEIDSSDSIDPEVYRPTYSKATEMILGILMHAYVDKSLKATELNSSLTFGIGNLLDDVPISLMQALQTQRLILIGANSP